MALYSGLPVARSHTTVVSRWLVMPTPSTCSGGYLGFAEHFPAGRDHRFPDIFRVVFDPPILWEVLRKLLLGNCRNLALAVKKNGAGAGRALIDGENKGGHSAFTLL